MNTSLDKVTTYILYNQREGKYYRSNSDYISANYTLVRNEIDATPLIDILDIIYLLEDLDIDEWSISIALKNLFLTEISLRDFVNIVIKENKI
jgi:hypothetical protein